MVISNLFTKQKVKSLKRLVVLTIAVLTVTASVPGLVNGRVYADPPVCRGFTRYARTNAGPLVSAYYPSLYNNADYWQYCILHGTHTGYPVYFMQDMLRRCYGQNQIAADGIYGYQTQLAHNNALAFHQFPPDHFYSEDVHYDLIGWRWPVYDASNNFLTCFPTPFNDPGWQKIVPV